MIGIGNVIFQILAIVILAGFYSIYIGKMILQKRSGIQTDQMAKGKKSKELFVTEIILKFATYSIVLVEIISIYKNTTLAFMPLRITGVIFGTVGVVLFGMAVHTMKDSWRAGIPESDKTDLVTTGVFSISRNPAFLAFDLIYLGILFMFFNWALFICTILSMTMLHLQIKQEEKFLIGTFSSEYQKYKQQTRRYIGRKASRCTQAGESAVNNEIKCRQITIYLT